MQSPTAPARPDVPAGLSDVDRELLAVATEIDACVLSDDAALRDEAGRRGRVVFGSLGVLEGAVRAGALTKDAALAIGQEFLSAGLRIDRAIFEDWRRRVTVEEPPAR